MVKVKLIQGSFIPPALRSPGESLGIYSQKIIGYSCHRNGTFRLNVLACPWRLPVSAHLPLSKNGGESSFIEEHEE